MTDDPREVIAGIVASTEVLSSAPEEETPWWPARPSRHQPLCQIP
jgi:hypothetical protein